MWYQIHNDTVKISVVSRPNAKQTHCMGVVGDALKIALHAAPVEGKANEELIAFLAKTFSIPKSAIKITHGKSSKKKIVQLPFDAKVESLLTVLSEGNF